MIEGFASQLQNANAMSHPASMSLIFLGVVVVVCCCFLFLLLLCFVDFLVVFLEKKICLEQCLDFSICKLTTNLQNPVTFAVLQVSGFFSSVSS